MKATKEDYKNYDERLFGDVEGAGLVNGGGLKFTDPDAKALYDQAIDKENNARLIDVQKNLVAAADEHLADTKHTTLADAEFLETVKSGIENSEFYKKMKQKELEQKELEQKELEQKELEQKELEQKLSKGNNFWLDIHNGTRKTPQQLDYIALADDTDKSKTDEYTLNPDMDDFPLDEQAKQIKDISNQIPEDVKDGGMEAVGEWLKSQTKKDASGNDVPKYRLPDLRLYQYLADNYKDETKVPKALAEKLMYGNRYNFYGSVVRDDGGDWRVPMLNRIGNILNRGGRWLGRGWVWHDRVLVFET